VKSFLLLLNFLVGLYKDPICGEGGRVVAEVLLLYICNTTPTKDNPSYQARIQMK
jgi:hypothetical protein